MSESDFGSASSAELQARMTSGAGTAASLVDACLQRITALDRRGPGLRALIEIDPDAREQAERLDAERRGGHLRSRLHGLPIVLKDNIATADRTQTTAGSLALVGSRPPRDAALVLRLRRAGCVLLAKANLSEWANFRSLRSSSGWSARGGQCANPYVLDRNPCGSSSGSAAALAADYVPLSIGTETDGSIVYPASVCGVVGLKPTVGLISRAGIVPISSTQDSAGPMARSVADVALLLGVLAGPDLRDPATAHAEGHRHADYTAFLGSEGLRGTRIGVVRQCAGFDPDVDTCFEAALADLRAGGATLVDPVELPDSREVIQSELPMLMCEFKTELGRYLRDLGGDCAVRSLADVIAFNETHADRELEYFDQALMVAAENKAGVDDPEYRPARAQSLQLARDQGIDRVVADHALHGLVAPTLGPAPPTRLGRGETWSGGCSTWAAAAGYPILTLPMGYVGELPVGLAFFGPAWSEPTLLRLASGYEHRAPKRMAPRFLPTAE